MKILDHYSRISGHTLLEILLMVMYPMLFVLIHLLLNKKVLHQYQVEIKQQHCFLPDCHQLLPVEMLMDLQKLVRIFQLNLLIVLLW